MGRYHHNNFLCYKTLEYALVKFLFLFMTKVNVNLLIILYDSDQDSLELMLNVKEKLSERDSTICQFDTYSIDTSKLKSSTILGKIQANKFVKYILIIPRDKALISLIIGDLKNSKVIKTVILHRRVRSAYRLKEDKLDLIFISGSYNLVNSHIARPLANAINKHQLNLNSASTTNITGRIIPKRFLDGFTFTLDVQVPRLEKLLMYHQWIKGGVVNFKLYGKYCDKRYGRSRATAEWLTSNITLADTFCRRNCSPGHYPIYTGHRDVAGCACFVKMNISKRRRVKMNAQNEMRKPRLPIKIGPFASHLHTTTIK